MSGRIVTSSAAESPKDFGTDAEGRARRWRAEIEFARKEQAEWERMARNIRDRYRDEGSGRMAADTDRAPANARFNILWSNIQTLHPALYAQPPVVVVKRRYDTQDDVGRIAATILERCITYQMHDQHFHTRMNETLLDYLLAGRGTMWLRYVPRFGPPPPVTTPLAPQPAPLSPSPIGGAGFMPRGAPMSAPLAPVGPPPTSGGLPTAGMPAMPGAAPLGIPAPMPLPGAPPIPPGPMGPPTPAAATMAGPATPPPLVASPAGAAAGAGAPPASGGAPAFPPTAPPMPTIAAVPSIPPGGLPIGTITDTDDAHQEQLQVANSGEGDESEFLAWEEVAIDHVAWDDWLCSPARTYSEVRWVARRVYMTRDELADRFGRSIADAVPLDWFPKQINESEAMQPENQLFRRAQVYEIWDKTSRKVFWLAYEHLDRLLDERDDPLRLLEFFPCPRPLFATQTTDTLVPVPDYRLYRDQAVQIDHLTARISALSRAIKVCGVYDAAQSDVERIFEEGIENQLIPVNQWGAFAEQGGLKGCLDLLDIGMLATVLQQLVEIRTQAKNDLYEVTGISDIIRGTTVATETATAQQLKAGFGTMRLRARQNEVSRFVRDVIRLVGDVVCEHFHPRTMLAMSEIQFSQDAELAPPAIALLKDERSRPFRIDMEADSTIMVNQQGEQQARLQFLQSAGQFIGQALPLVQQAPELGTLAGQMLLFGIRSFPQGAELESAFEQAVAQLEQAAKSGQLQPQQPQQQKGPDPQLTQAQIANLQSQVQARQAEQQRAQMQLQAQIANQQADNQRDGMEAVSKVRERQAGMALDLMKARAEHARGLLELHGGRVDAAHDFLLNVAKMQQPPQGGEDQAA